MKDKIRDQTEQAAKANEEHYSLSEKLRVSNKIVEEQTMDLKVKESRLVIIAYTNRFLSY